MLDRALGEASERGILTKCCIPLRRAFAIVWMHWLKCKFGFSKTCVVKASPQAEFEILSSPFWLFPFCTARTISPRTLPAGLSAVKQVFLHPHPWAATESCSLPPPAASSEGSHPSGLLSYKAFVFHTAAFFAKPTSPILRPSLRAQTCLLRISTEDPSSCCFTLLSEYLESKHPLVFLSFWVETGLQFCLVDTLSEGQWLNLCRWV